MYNSLSTLPSIPYKIIEYLATSPKAENLWKMLKYPEYDALSKPNLTTREKLKLLWRNGPQEEHSVFLTGLIEDAIAESRCIFKMYNYYDRPVELYISNIVYAFDFLYGGQISLVDYNGIPVSRGDLFIHTILNTLNGVEVGGVGKLMFYENFSRYNIGKSVVGDMKKFTGVSIYLGIKVGDTGSQSGCES